MSKQFNKEDIIKDLRENVYCRLGKSNIHGVGVFAIRDISEGTNPFSGFRTSEEGISISKQEIANDPLISEAVKGVADEFMAVQGGEYLFPQTSLNEIGIAFYVNHSETPNLREEGDEFYTTRAIKTGEELTANYRTYAENL